MVKESKSNPAANKKNIVSKPVRSLAIFETGITNSQQYAKAMSALMTDIVTGAISPGVSNAVRNAGGKLLKLVELEYKYGKHTESGGKTLDLIR